jgi:hypothetical protein
MGAVAHLDHHEQLMQHGNDDGREQMVWSNREQEETNAYATTPESRQAGSGTDAQTGGSPVRSSEFQTLEFSTHRKLESTSKNTQVHNI